jgi:hypothetical protein
MFKECPHPDEKQRLQLSRELGLAPRQIKFWFQNRRTQMKVLLSFFLSQFQIDFSFLGVINIYIDICMHHCLAFHSGST